MLIAVRLLVGSRVGVPLEVKELAVLDSSQLLEAMEIAVVPHNRFHSHQEGRDHAVHQRGSQGALRLVGSSDFQIGHDGPGLMEVLRNTMKPRSSCR